MAEQGLVFFLVAVLAIALTMRSWWYRKHGSDVAGTVVFLLVLYCILITVCTLGFNMAQVSNQENVRREAAEIAVHEDRVKVLLPVLVRELRSYPQYEAATLASVLEGKGGLIALPPELKANAAVLATVKEIRGANDEVYQRRIRIERLRYAIRMNQRIGPWFSIYLIKTEEG